MNSAHRPSHIGLATMTSTDTDRPTGPIAPTHPARDSAIAPPHGSWTTAVTQTHVMSCTTATNVPILGATTYHTDPAGAIAVTNIATTTTAAMIHLARLHTYPWNHTVPLTNTPTHGAVASAAPHRRLRPRHSGHGPAQQSHGTSAWLTQAMPPPTAYRTQPC